MYASINGLNLHYVDRGRREGESILFLHGFPFDHSMWRFQLDAFAPRYRCIAPDLRGHGATTVAGDSSTSASTGVTVDLMADDVQGLLDYLNISQATVCGLSMGGYIAFGLWRRHPHSIRRIVFADTKAGPDSPEARANRFALAERVKTYGAQAAADAMLPRLLAPHNQTGELAQEVRRMIESTQTGAIIQTLHALASRPDSTGLLAGLHVPCLVVVGQNDILTPQADAQTIFSGAARAWRLVEIPNAGHLSPLENPAAFNAALAEFLQAT